MSSLCTDYEGDIRLAVKRWWPDLPVWRLWEAQILAESQCNPLAQSAVGAAGLAQIMPATARDLARVIGMPADTRSAKFAIPAGAAYMASLRHQWAGRNRAALDSHWLGVASYNRGTGNIIADQKECGDALYWPAVSVCTAQHTAETPAYVSRIQRYWVQLEAH